MLQKLYTREIVLIHFCNNSFLYQYVYTFLWILFQNSMIYRRNLLASSINLLYPIHSKTGIDRIFESTGFYEAA